MVLNDISFSVNPGELMCVLGANGVGKSTMLKCILGILPGYQGDIFVNDKEIRSMSPRERAEQIAYIPQANNPAFNYSVLDMVLMGTSAQLSGFGEPGKAEEARAKEALQKMEIEHLENRGYAQISGGEQQLVLIARALAQGAKILVMDEPTSNLDYGNQMRTHRQLRKLADEGYTILQSTHHPEQTYLFADRILCMQDGKIFVLGTPQEVINESLMRELYRVDVEMLRAEDDRARFFIPKE
jgi:iron complex transport system ATP-binding protein